MTNSIILPSDATARSHELTQIVQELLNHAPESVPEILLDGSVARGLADRFSDIELQFFSDPVPSLETILLWMREIGFVGNPLVRMDEPDTRLINDHFQNVRIELFWVSFDYEEKQLSDVFERMGGSQFVNEAYKWSDGIILRSGDHTMKWKSLFSNYPDSLRDKYILPILEHWQIMLKDPIDTLGRWKDAYRGAWFYLLKTHWMDVLPMLRIVFAYNRIWQPVAKWWHVSAAKARHKPEKFVARVNDVLSNPDPVARIDQLSQLQIDVLQLISDEYDVDDILDKCIAVRAHGLEMGSKS